jgi:uncharacterized protein
MFYFSIDADHFTRMLTQFDFGGPEPYFDETLFGANPQFRVLPLETTVYDRNVLLLEKHTGSWAFLEPPEFDIFRSLDGTDLNGMMARVPDSYRGKLPEFIARLYWRGLLRINGRRFIEPEVFDRGPVFYSGGLFVVIPTEQCNLACKYCFAKSGPSRQERMDWAVAKRAMDLIIGYIPERGSVEFAGGEALIEIDLIEQIVEYGTKSAEKAGKQLKFRVQSNGTLFTQDLLERIETLGIAVGISLDGDRVSNDMTRVFPGQKGTHSAIAKSVALMREQGFTVGAVCVVSKANCHRLDKVMADYMELSMEGIKLNPIAKHGRACYEWDELALEAEEFLETHTTYLDLVLNQGYSVLDENTAHMLRALGTRMHQYRCMRSQCGAGRDFMTFATNGDVYPCPRTRSNSEFRLGNVAEVDRLDEIWKNNPVISKLAERQVGAIAECRECTYKRFCEAGCPISSYEHFGTTDAIHPWCQYYKGIYSELFRRLGDESRLVEIFCPDAKIYENSFFIENAV